MPARPKRVDSPAMERLYRQKPWLRPNPVPTYGPEHQRPTATRRLPMDVAAERLRRFDDLAGSRQTLDYGWKSGFSKLLRERLKGEMDPATVYITAVDLMIDLQNGIDSTTGQRIPNRYIPLGWTNYSLMLMHFEELVEVTLPKWFAQQLKEFRTTTIGIKSLFDLTIGHFVRLKAEGGKEREEIADSQEVLPFIRAIMVNAISTGPTRDTIH